MVRHADLAEAVDEGVGVVALVSDKRRAFAQMRLGQVEGCGRLGIAGRPGQATVDHQSGAVLVSAWPVKARRAPCRPPVGLEGRHPLFRLSG